MERYDLTLKAPTTVEAVRRAFLVLECLNARSVSSIQLLHNETGLPKATLSRLLETLIALGYVEQISREFGYRITGEVMNLVSGIRFVDHLIDVAMPKLRQFTRTYKWPIGLGQIENNALIVRYTTTLESPLSFAPTNYNKRQSVLTTALGRVILAHLPIETRMEVLKNTLARSVGKEKVELQITRIEKTLESIRHAGYAATSPLDSRQLHGLAVPLLYKNTGLGGINIRFPRSVMTEPSAVRKFLTPLKRVSEAISSAAFPESMS